VRSDQRHEHRLPEQGLPLAEQYLGEPLAQSPLGLGISLGVSGPPKAQKTVTPRVENPTLHKRLRHPLSERRELARKPLDPPFGRLWTRSASDRAERGRKQLVLRLRALRRSKPGAVLGEAPPIHQLEQDGTGQARVHPVGRAVLAPCVVERQEHDGMGQIEAWSCLGLARHRCDLPRSTGRYSPDRNP
jgi:hypothetical protein